jgi:outer membrane protein OmpA-like peptidoglycan-associated protein
MRIKNRFFLLFSVVLFSSSLVFAKGFDIQTFHLSSSPHGFFSTQGGELSTHLQFSSGLGFVYGKDVLQLSVLESDGTQSDVGGLVQHRLDAVWTASLGLWNWVELGVALPVAWQQGKDAQSFTQVGVALSGGSLRAWGLGDMRIFPKVKLLNIRNGLFAMAFTPQVVVPSGGGAVYASSNTWGFAPVLNMSTRVQRMRAGLDLGYRIRDKAHVASLAIDDEVFWKAAVAYNVLSNANKPLEITGELFGYTGVKHPFGAGLKGTEKDLQAALTSLEAMLGARWWAWEHVLVSGGVGMGLMSGYGAALPRVYIGATYFSGSATPKDGDMDGVVDGIDQCPDKKEDRDGFKDDDGCPEPDNDEDHFADEDDACPLEAEDKDGFEDDDGCPEADNDKDGVLDTQDACAMQAEDKDGFKDDDGCPDVDNDEDGVLEGVDACPLEKEDVDGYEDWDGCLEPDNDQDGLLDTADACPDYAEDKDGVKDADGCPEENDDDGVPDASDACPAQSETFNGVKDADGCPEPSPASEVQMLGDEIKLKNPVGFQKGTAVLAPPAQAVLEHLVAMMKVRKDIALLRIVGYADPSLSVQKAKILSQARQTVVAQYLQKRGVARDRLDVGLASETLIRSAKWRFGVGLFVSKKNPVGVDVKTMQKNPVKTQQPSIEVEIQGVDEPAKKSAEEGGIEFGF